MNELPERVELGPDLAIWMWKHDVTFSVFEEWSRTVLTELRREAPPDGMTVMGHSFLPILALYDHERDRSYLGTSTDIDAVLVRMIQDLGSKEPPRVLH